MTAIPRRKPIKKPAKNERRSIALPSLQLVGSVYNYYVVTELGF